VNGIIDFGMILSVLKGKNILGKFNFASAPISEILKKLSFGLAKSLEAPIFPLNPISKVSAPLNTFRIPQKVFPEIPKSWMFECVKSVEKPKVYFFLGDK
jgi:hypothetical protein